MVGKQEIFEILSQKSSPFSFLEPDWFYVRPLLTCRVQIDIALPVEQLAESDLTKARKQ